MGLDMHLNRKRYIWSSSKGNNDEVIKQCVSVLAKLLGTESIRPDKLKQLEEEVFYWRKANAIHEWFVKSIQDGKDECQESYVPEEKLRELLEVCQRVKADHSLAEELLPTKEGFFFGSLEYDEYYFESLEHTIQGIEEALAMNNEGWDFYYRASW